MMSTMHLGYKKTVIVLYPRLDVPFKKFDGTVPDARGAIEPIRVHWQRFIEQVVREHIRRGDTVIEIERPLWQFTPEFLGEIVKDTDTPYLVYIPHHTEKTFPINLPNVSPRYYMQTVFPHCFTVDPKGWGPSMSSYPFEVSPDLLDISDMMHRLAPFYARIQRNVSKFPQSWSNRTHFPSSYDLFVCQIPHDQSIQLHSKVSVEAALKTTLEWARENGRHILVRGHVINPGSMEKLRALTHDYPEVSTWEDGYTCSIHEVIARAESVITVNSGAGIEAILHNKPVVAFGRAEYDTVSVTLDRLLEPISLDLQKSLYQLWLSSYLDHLYDTTSGVTFGRLQ